MSRILGDNQRADIYGMLGEKPLTVSRHSHLNDSASDDAYFSIRLAEGEAIISSHEPINVVTLKTPEPKQSEPRFQILKLLGGGKRSREELSPPVLPNPLEAHPPIWPPISSHALAALAAQN